MSATWGTGALVAALGASSAMAQTAVDAPVSLDFDVAALVRQECAVDSGRLASELGRALSGARPGDTREARLPVTCNAPFRLRVQSARGGLTLDGLDPAARAAAGNEGVATSINYAVTLHMPYLDAFGAAGVEVASCASSVTMAAGGAGCALSALGGVAIPGASLRGDGRLVFTLERPVGVLAAGALTDSILVHVEPGL